MSFLHGLKLGWKLPLMLVAIALVSLSVMGVSAYREARAVLAEEASQRLEASLAVRAQAAAQWADQVQSNLRAMAADQGTARLMRDFSSAWKRLGPEAAENLRRAWVDTNPHPEGLRWKLDFAGEVNDYGILHRRAHPGFVTLAKERGLADLAFVDPLGRVLYSLHKGADFAADLTSPAEQDGILARTVAAALARQEEAAAVSEFHTRPRDGARLLYLAQVVRSAEGVKLGVLALVVNLDPLASMIAAPQSLGRTGQAYLLDAEGVLQTPLRGIGPAVGTAIDTPAAQALRGAQAGRSETIGIDGGRVQAVQAPLTLFGRPMGLVVEQSEAELFAPARQLGRTLAFDALWLVALLAAISAWMARGIARPMHGLAAAINRISAGDHAVVVPATKLGDEVGEIAQALEALRGDLAASQRVQRAATVQGTAFRKSSAALMVVDADLAITYVNEALEKLIAAKIDDFRLQAPDLRSDALVGCPLAALFPFTPDIAAKLADSAQMPFHNDVAVGVGRYGVDFSEIRDTDGGRIGMVVEWRDVTELRMTRALLNAIDSTQLMLEFAPAGHVTRGNANLLAALGATEAGLLGRDHAGLIEGVGPLAGFWSRLAKLEPVIGCFHLTGADGRAVVAEGSVTPVPDRAGNMLKIVLIANDITEAQAALDQARAENEAMLDGQRRVVEALRVSLENLAKGALGEQIDTAFPLEYDQLRVNFNNATNTLAGAIQVVVENTHSIGGEVSEISNAASDLSQRTERQAATLAETVSALDQLTTSIGVASVGISEADQMVEQARVSADGSGRVVSQAVVAMGEIAQSSQQISRIIGVIEDIAFQTNLLALNAGVEAARAGEAGRGFAVVASEVRALAQRSSAAAQEIAALITTSSDHVRVGVDLVGQTGQALAAILGSVTEIAARVSKIACSAREQASGLSEINSAMLQLDQVTQQNAAMFEETTAAAQSLSRGVQALTATTARFHIPKSLTAPQITHSGGGKTPIDTPKESVMPPRPRAITGTGGHRSQALAAGENEWVDF